MTPRRVQRRRAKGWRMPDGAVYVGRPSKWGNPFPVDGESPFSREDAVRMYRELLVDGETWWGEHRFTGWQHDNDRPRPSMTEICVELRRRDLVCWCPPDVPCHADVLLELANVEEPVR